MYKHYAHMKNAHIIITILKVDNFLKLHYISYTLHQPDDTDRSERHFYTRNTVCKKVLKHLQAQKTI